MKQILIGLILIIATQVNAQSQSIIRNPNVQIKDIFGHKTNIENITKDTDKDGFMNIFDSDDKNPNQNIFDKKNTLIITTPSIIPRMKKNGTPDRRFK